MRFETTLGYFLQVQWKIGTYLIKITWDNKSCESLLSRQKSAFKANKFLMAHCLVCRTKKNIYCPILRWQVVQLYHWYEVYKIKDSWKGTVHIKIYHFPWIDLYIYNSDDKKKPLQIKLIRNYATTKKHKKFTPAFGKHLQ